MKKYFIKTPTNTDELYKKYSLGHHVFSDIENYGPYYIMTLAESQGPKEGDYLITFVDYNLFLIEIVSRCEVVPCTDMYGCTVYKNSNRAAFMREASVRNANLNIDPEIAISCIEDAINNMEMTAMHEYFMSVDALTKQSNPFTKLLINFVLSLCIAFAGWGVFILVVSLFNIDMAYSDYNFWTIYSLSFALNSLRQLRKIKSL